MSQQVLERPIVNSAEALAKKYPPLTALDRCDAANVVLVDGVKTQGKCGAQAFIRAVLPSGLDLLFCGHCVGEQTVGRNATGKKSEKHATRREALEAAGAHLVSDYHKINLKPTDPKADGF
jgi:hypothetical protein